MSNHDLIEQHVNQVNRMAWSFVKTTGLSFEDLQAEGMATFCECVNKFDPEKGCKLSTLVEISVRNSLISYIGMRKKHQPTESVVLECNYSDHARRFEFLDTLSSLGDAAKTIVDIILSGPSEVLGIAEDSSPCKIRAAIKPYLKEIGFNKRQIEFGIGQIKSII